MSQLALDLARASAPGDRWPRHGRSAMVWCWGLCGGWGWREEDLADTSLQPCDGAGCLRELGHGPPHNPRGDAR